MRQLLTFFSLTYVVSWTFFCAAAVASAGPDGSGFATSAFSYILLLIGVFAPSFVALSLTAMTDGRAGVAALLRQIVNRPTRLRWYLFAVGYMAAIKLSVALIHRIAAGEWPVFGRTPILVMAGALVISTPTQAGEEIGWRAFALPRLWRHLGLGPASVVLGIIWACWHLPLFFIPGTDTAGQSFPVYLLQVTALSVAMAWLYWRTRGSLLTVMLLHAAVNNTKDIVPSVLSGAANPLGLTASPVAWLTVALLWTCGAFFLVRMRGADVLRDLGPDAKRQDLFGPVVAESAHPPSGTL